MLIELIFAIKAIGLVDCVTKFRKNDIFGNFWPIGLAHFKHDNSSSTTAALHSQSTYKDIVCCWSDVKCSKMGLNQLKSRKQEIPEKSKPFLIYRDSNNHLSSTNAQHLSTNKIHQLESTDLLSFFHITWKNFSFSFTLQNHYFLDLHSS